MIFSNKRKRRPKSAPKVICVIASLVIAAIFSSIFGSTSEPEATNISPSNDKSIKAAKEDQVQAVDCAKVRSIEPVNIGPMKSINPYHYVVSYGWWDKRLDSQNFGTVPSIWNDSILTVHQFLKNASPKGAFIDIGANVGFMTHIGLAQGRPTYAIEPISYNIAKICEGHRANVEHGHVSATTPFFLYHGAAGATFEPQVEIYRPSESFGLFDQSSMSREAVNLAHETEVEHIPMFTVDMIIPVDQPIAMVKIDVQGYEYNVFCGMQAILARKSSFPEYILYEESESLIVRSGNEPGASQRLVESFGYKCDKRLEDILCHKALEGVR